MFSAKRHSEPPQKPYSLSADILRIGSIVAVIALHTLTPITTQFGHIGLFSFLTAVSIESLTRFAVGLMFMVSGALLLDKEEDPKVFYQKRLFTVALPFLFWNLFYLLHTQQYHLKGFIKLFALPSTWFNTFFSSHMYHLWFVPVIMGLYLVTPILRNWLKKSNKKTLNLALGIWAVVVFFDGLSLILGVGKLVTSNFLVALGFFLLGYYLTKHPLTYRPRVYLFTIAMCWFFVAGGTWALSHLTGTFNEALYHYSSLPNLLITVALFSFVMSLRFNRVNSSVVRIVKSLAWCSYGIYLVHALVLNKLVERYWPELFTGQYNSLIIATYVPIVVVATFIMSFFVIFVMKKTPLLKYFA